MISLQYLLTARSYAEPYRNRPLGEKQYKESRPRNKLQATHGTASGNCAALRTRRHTESRLATGALIPTQGKQEGQGHNPQKVPVSPSDAALLLSLPQEPMQFSYTFT